MKKKSLKIFLLLVLIFLSGCKSKGDRTEEISLVTNDEIYSDDVTNITNIDDFVRKIWIVDEWESGVDYPISLVMEPAEQENVKGYFRMGYNVASDYFSYMDKREKIPEFSGKINGSMAQCRYDYKNGREGAMDIYFYDNDRIKVVVDGNSNESYLLRPYNITDQDFLNEITFYKAEVDVWGMVTIAYGICNARHPVPCVLFLSEQNDILYRFGGFTTDSEVKEVIIEDINGDGLTDVEVVTFFSYAPDEYRFEDFFYQEEDGHFYLEKSNKLGKEWGNM